MKIEGAERGVIGGFGQQRQRREQLATLVIERRHRSLENVVTFLGQIKVGKVQLAAAVGIGCPGIEVSFVGQVTGDETRQNAGNQRVTVAMLLQIGLDRLRVAADAAGAKQRLGIRRAEAGQTFAEHAGNRLAGGIEQDAGRQPGGQQQFRRRGTGESAQQFIILGTDRRTRIAVGNFVARACILIGKLRGIDAMVGDQHTFQTIQYNQPRLGREVLQQ